DLVGDDDLRLLGRRAGRLVDGRGKRAQLFDLDDGHASPPPSIPVESTIQFGPAPPPAYDSEQMARDLEAIKAFPRTNATIVTATYREYSGGPRVHKCYYSQTSQKLLDYRLDGS